MRPRTSVERVERWCYPEGARPDHVAIEEPLEIVLSDPSGRALKLATTLRTPGHDYELALGYLYSLALVSSMAEIGTLSYCGSGPAYNRLVINYRAALPARAYELRRNDISHSGCGACGDTDLSCPPTPAVRPLDNPADPQWLLSLPPQLRAGQKIFERCGGTHAAASVAAHASIAELFEDVGRHNAVDKVVGSLLLARRLPADGQWLVLSGRAGWELVQKAAQAGFAGVLSVGAPTSRAIAVARGAGLCLAGFAQRERFNVYTLPEAIAGLSGG
jgi:FdhD protein